MADRLRAVQWLAGVLALSCASPAAADCISNQLRFDLAANEVLSSSMTITGRGCTRSFTGGLSISYESITVAERPRHMLIEPASNGFGYRIRVQGGYKGQDRFAIRACGKGTTGRGCVTIAYDVTIR